MIHRLRVVWRRARRTGRDLEAAAYAAGIVGGVIFLAAMTGVLGPTLDAPGHHLGGAERHASR